MTKKMIPVYVVIRVRSKSNFEIIGLFQTIEEARECAEQSLFNPKDIFICPERMILKEDE